MKDKRLKFQLFYTGVVLVIVILLGLLSYSNYIENKYPWHHYETHSYKLLNNLSGEGITIAFLDSGLHKDLVEQFGSRIVSPFNVIEQNSNINDLSGHGTKMICVSACSYDQQRIYGLAYKANIMPVVVVDASGRTSGEYLSQGIIYAFDHGADIINISLGSRLENTLVKEAIAYAYENNVIVVAAGGDYQEDRVLFPARYETVIAVQAQSKLGVRYKHASWGDSIDLLVPGEFIETLGINHETLSLEIVYESGSSISTAFITSVVALMIQQQENIKSMNYYFI